MQVADRPKVAFHWYVAIGAIVAVLAAGEAFGAPEYGIIEMPYSDRMPHMIHRWISMMVWPGLPLIVIVQWVLPQLKHGDEKVQGSIIRCFALLVAGAAVEVYGATVSGGTDMGAVLILMGAALQLGGAVVYLAVVWRTLMRSLRPAVYDTFLLIGGVWLTGINVIHLLYTAMIVVGCSTEVFQRTVICIDVSFIIGFSFNSLLGLFTAIMPHFLSTHRPGARTLNSVVAFNIALVAWVVAAAWSLQFPYTWVRLALSLFSVLMFSVLVYLLMQLRVYEWMSVTVSGSRRVVARMTASAAIVCGIVGIGIITGIGIALGGTSAVVISDVQTFTEQVLQIGLGGFGLLALYIGLLGPAASTRWSIGLVCVAGGLLALGLVGVVIPEIASAIEYRVWYDPRVAYGVLSVAYLLVAVWLASHLPWWASET